MERQDSGGIQKRPELDRNDPSQLFTYATQAQRWIHERVSEDLHAERIDSLIETLDTFVHEKFAEMPELRVQATDVVHTKGFAEVQPGIYRIDAEQLPFDVDAQLLGEHTIEGTLHGFHRGANSELRMYVARSEVSQKLKSGIFTPLLSIAVQESAIHYKSDEREREISESKALLQARLAEYDDQEIVSLVDRIENYVHDSRTTIASRLHGCSSLVAEIARMSSMDEKLIDAVLDYIRETLDLTSPHDIHTSAHRVHISDHPIRSHQRGGAALFENVTPQLGLMGESANRTLGLFISNEEKSISISVEFVTVIQKVNT